MAVDMDKVRARFRDLQDQRSPYEARYRDLARYILPDSGRFEASSTQSAKAADPWTFVYDASATDAAGALAAGLLGGITSPARPWFRLTTGDPEADERFENRQWLSQTTELLQTVFLRSNVYPALIQAYEELAVFGTACIIALPSESDDIIHLFPMTVGEYWIAEDYENRVNTVFRRISMTAEQMVEQFGQEKVSSGVRECLTDDRKRNQRFQVIHGIFPRDGYDPKKKDNRNFPWVSVYFEETYENDGRSSGSRTPLLEEGFSTFPGLCPRWEIHGGSVYGTSPGMKALREVKGLQVETKRKRQGIDELTNPAMIYPASMENHQLDFTPGGISFYPDGGTPQQAYPAKQVNVNLQHLLADIQDSRQKINEYFYKDLFTAIMSTPRTNRTAYEVDQVAQERMALLGPVLQRLNGELLRPLIRMGLYALEKAKVLSPMPSGMQGVTVTFESILVQALRSAGITAEDRYLSTAFSIANFDQTIVDNVDLDKLMQKRAIAQGVDPDILRAPEDVQKMRAARQEQQAQQAQMAQAMQMSEVVKNMQATNPGIPNVGSIQSLQGY